MGQSTTFAAMKVVLLVVGKTTDAHFAAAIQDYVQRIRHYLPFDVEVVPELKNTKSLSPEQQKAKEAEGVKKLLQPGDAIVLLDEHGREYRSVDFAAWMQKKMMSGARRLVFVVGGPYGFAPDIYALGQEKISLSRMTFSHQMIRLLFTEQIYRALTILNNEPYHHE